MAARSDRCHPLPSRPRSRPPRRPLAGLLFVAVSINLKRILEFPSLPARAGQTLMLFVMPLITGLFLVVPGQPAAILATG